MRSIRETYDLPRKPPTVFRFAAFVVVFAVGAPLLWLVLPDGVVSVAVLALFLLVFIAVALRWILSSREIEQRPPRRPVPTRPD